VAKTTFTVRPHLPFENLHLARLTPTPYQLQQRTSSTTTHPVNSQTHHSLSPRRRPTRKPALATSAQSPNYRTPKRQIPRQLSRRISHQPTYPKPISAHRLSQTTHSKNPPCRTQRPPHSTPAAGNAQYREHLDLKYLYLYNPPQPRLHQLPARPTPPPPTPLSTQPIASKSKTASRLSNSAQKTWTPRHFGHARYSRRRKQNYTRGRRS
jgi:hypothetical protein